MYGAPPFLYSPHRPPILPHPALFHRGPGSRLPFRPPHYYNYCASSSNHVVHKYYEGGAIPFGRGGKNGPVFMNARQAGRIGAPVGLKVLQQVSSQFLPKKDNSVEKNTYVTCNDVTVPDNIRVTTKAELPSMEVDPEITVFDTTPKDFDQANHLEDIMIKCLTIKQEKFDEYDSMYASSNSANLNVENWRNAKIDYKNANGRFYFSSLTEEDILAGKTENWLATTSTLSNINCKTECKSNIVSVECPGATLKQMIRPLLTELKSCVASSPINLLVVGGVNNFLQQMSVEQVVAEAKQLKKAVNFIFPNAKITFVQIPLIPSLCKLPDDDFYLSKSNNRTLDFLVFNDTIKFELSDKICDVSLQNIGLLPLRFGSSYWPGKLKFYVTGKSHDPTQWRETHLFRGVHLKDTVRINFWNSKIRPFFNA